MLTKIIIKPIALLIISIFMLMHLAASTFAQTDIVDELADKTKKLDQTASILIRISTPRERTDESLASARIKFQNLLSDATQLTKSVDEQLATITTRLTEMGPVPKDDEQPEDPIVKEARAKFNSDRSKLAVTKTEIEATVARAREQISQISVRRQDAFTSAIFKRTDLTSSLYSDAVNSMKEVFNSAASLFSSWVKWVFQNKFWEALGTLVISLVGAVIITFNFNRYFGSYLYAARENPGYFNKLFYAFWATLLPSLAIAIFLQTTYWLFVYFGLHISKVQQILFALTLTIIGIVFAWNLSKALFAPNSAEWRLISMSNKAAKSMFWLTFLLLLVQTVDYFVETANQIFSGTVEQTALQGIVAAILIGGILILMAVVKPNLKISETITKSDWPKWFSIPMILIGAVIIISAVVGYIGLARFISQQMIVTGAIIVMMAMGILAARELAREGVFGSTALGKFLTNKKGMEAISVEQISLGASIVFILGVLTAGIPAILLQWGTTTEEISNFASRMFTGFDIGNVRFSLSGILFGLFVFIVGVIITRLIKRWLTRSVFPRMRADVGVRESINSGLGYLGYGLAGLFAVTAAGLDLSNLALVAGALSLGIGFGLQNIVSNFVSGLILLIERPIKTGDWIVVGAAEGNVKRISVRATEIETFQKKSIIIPNSELINSQVGNWTFKSKSGRVDVPVGVAYGTDVKVVEKILYEIAAAHPMVAKKPEANVWFQGFGDSSLDFSLRMHLYDINNTVTVESDVRFQILERFEELGIDIPFPQRDLHIKYEGETPKQKALRAPPAKKK